MVMVQNYDFTYNYIGIISTFIRIKSTFWYYIILLFTYLCNKSYL